MDTQDMIGLGNKVLREKVRETSTIEKMVDILFCGFGMYRKDM